MVSSDNNHRSSVAHAEQELSAIGRRMHLQEKRDMSKSLSKPSVGRIRDGRGNSAAVKASAKPKRSSLDNVGEREVKVHPLIISLDSSSDGTGFEVCGSIVLWHLRQLLMFLLQQVRLE